MNRSWPLATAVVALVTGAVYGSSLDNYFAQDDFGVVSLLSGKSVADIPRWFVSTWMDDIWGFTPDEIRPFPAMSYQILSWLGPTWPAPNHLLNIVLHAGSALLVMGLARTALGVGVVGSTVAALVFVILPNQVETVAWITGRVDSLPAFFYLAATLSYARWRAGHGGRMYAAAVALCFLALYSKQNAIMLAPALVLYDGIVLGRPIRPTWSWVRPYVPFVALTAAYLGLRYVVFDQIVREQMLTGPVLGQALTALGAHMTRVTFGAESIVSGPATLVAAGLVAVTLAAVVQSSRGQSARPLVRGVVYFGVAWLTLSLAPTLVAGYSSPRHAYLATAGWAVVVGLFVDACRIHEGQTLATRRVGRRIVHASAALGVAAIFAGYGLLLYEGMSAWHRQSVVSRRAVADLERVALAAPPGSLVIAGAPATSWAWALPFAARPPFTATDLLRRVDVIGPARLHCCGWDQWDAYTRQRLSTWAARAERTPVIALHWDPRTGALSQLSDADDPSLRGVLRLLLDTRGPEVLESNLERLLDNYVASRRPTS